MCCVFFLGVALACGCSFVDNYISFDMTFAILFCFCCYYSWFKFIWYGIEDKYITCGDYCVTFLFFGLVGRELDMVVCVGLCLLGCDVIDICVVSYFRVVYLREAFWRCEVVLCCGCYYWRGMWNCCARFYLVWAAIVCFGLWVLMCQDVGEFKFSDVRASISLNFGWFATVRACICCVLYTAMGSLGCLQLRVVIVGSLIVDVGYCIADIAFISSTTVALDVHVVCNIWVCCYYGFMGFIINVWLLRLLIFTCCDLIGTDIMTLCVMLLSGFGCHDLLDYILIFHYLVGWCAGLWFGLSWQNYINVVWFSMDGVVLQQILYVFCMLGVMPRGLLGIMFGGGTAFKLVTSAFLFWYFCLLFTGYFGGGCVICITGYFELDKFVVMFYLREYVFSCRLVLSRIWTYFCMTDLEAMYCRLLYYYFCNIFVVVSFAYKQKYLSFMEVVVLLQFLSFVVL
eukprot:gene3405-2356_t